MYKRQVFFYIFSYNLWVFLFLSMSVKFSDIVRQYDGEGDFFEWVEKLELVAKLQK